MDVTWYPVIAKIILIFICVVFYGFFVLENGEQVCDEVWKEESQPNVTGKQGKEYDQKMQAWALSRHCAYFGYFIILFVIAGQIQNSFAIFFALVAPWGVQKVITEVQKYTLRSVRKKYKARFGSK